MTGVQTCALPIWVVSLTLAGYFLGRFAWVQQNFTLVIYGIILFSVLPPLFSFLKDKFGSKPTAIKS